MECDLYKTLDLVLKALGLVVVLAGAIRAYYTYRDTKEKEFYSVFWNQKLALFLETSEAASTMATTESVDEFNKARTKYRELFFGRLSLVEGGGVKAAMEEFVPVVPKGTVARENLPFLTMQQPAYRLTLALKEELGNAWREPFGEL